MNANASKQEISYVTTTISAMNKQIKSYTYLDDQQSYEKAKQLFSNNSTIIQALSPSTTPSVFNCLLVNPNDAEAVAATFFKKGAGGAGIAQVPGVYSVAFPEQSI